MKRIFTILMAATFAFTITACGKRNDDTVPATETAKTAAETTIETMAETSPGSNEMVGGWNINEGSLFPGDNKEATDAFEKAAEGLEGYRYEVVAVLGEQVVAGTNYSYLCKGKMVIPDAKTEYVIVNVYETLDGNCELTGAKNVLDEGWEYNQGEKELASNPEVEALLNKALEGFTGSSFEPIAYLGNMGEKYAIFATATGATLDAEKSYVIIYVEKSEDGSASITDIADVDMAVS